VAATASELWPESVEFIQRVGKKMSPVF